MISIMKKQIWIYLSVVFVALSGCGPKQFYETTQTGLQYYFFDKNKDGKMGNVGDIYSVNITVCTDKLDTAVYSQFVMFQRNEPVYPGDFHEGLGMLHENDSVSFKLHVDSFFRMHNLGIPKDVESDSLFRLHIGVVSIMSPKEHFVFKCEEELGNMKEFVARKGWEVTSDSTGIMYEVVTSNPEGDQLQMGDSVELKYTYSTLDDRIIERTRENDRWKFEVGSFQTRVSGLTRILTLMRDGEKVRSVIPFAEAFGPEGMGPLIPPYTTIVLEIEAYKLKQ